jgi:hypothetical protein
MYLYNNPQSANCDEAKQMLRVGEIIADEFWIKVKWKGCTGASEVCSLFQMAV